MTLRGLVGRLRRELVENPRSDAAAALAKLADARVPGAHPSGWHGLPPASTVRPVFDLTDDDPVRVSPSKLHSFEESPVTWFVEQFGGGTSNAAAGLGTVIHAVMESADDPSVETLWSAVEARWSELRFDAEWLSLRQRRLAKDMVRALAHYLADFAAQDGRLIGAESRFSLRIGPAQLNGSVDRVEQFPDGRVVIVDLKTGKHEPRTDAGVANHPQLASYQVALDAKVVVGIPEGATPGGAKLVLIGTAGSPYAAPTQAPFSPEQIAAFRDEVERIAVEMAGPSYRKPAEKPGRPGRFDIHQSGSVAE
jgi:RecB family exonuclease